jgi:tyrosinase
MWLHTIKREINRRFAMHARNFTRRHFLQSASALFFASIPGKQLLAQGAPVQRPDWDTFKSAPNSNYSSLMDAIASMRANTNSSDKRSWSYWVNVHVNNCPHEISYFLAWHRGYLYYFEQQLRAVSGNQNLVLPYWDYYTNPNIPPEFTNPASYNPLYQSRVNTNVANALTLAPFDSSVVNMQRGLANAFEPSFESAPHNPVHNIIGNIMGGMTSPTDPIFWLHHANIDRLWSAWELAGGGRIVPPPSDSYWNGNFAYATRLSMARSRTIDTRTYLSYYYRNETMPTSLPVAAAEQDEQDGFLLAGTGEDIQLAQLGAPTSTNTPRLLARPPVGQFTLSDSRTTGANRLSLGGVLRISLSEESVSARVPLSSASSNVLQNVFNEVSVAPGGVITTTQTGPYRSAQLVLDNVRIVGPGIAGGYFYYVFVNLPSNTDIAQAVSSYRIGTLGPFEVDSALHRAHMNLGPGGTEGGTARLVFSATLLLKELMASDPGGLTISFVRVSGETSPAGEVIIIGEARLELSSDNP